MEAEPIGNQALELKRDCPTRYTRKWRALEAGGGSPGTRSSLTRHGTERKHTSNEARLSEGPERVRSWRMQEEREMNERKVVVRSAAIWYPRRWGEVGAVEPGLQKAACAVIRRVITLKICRQHTNKSFKKNWLENELEKHKFSKAEKFSLTESNNLGAAEAVVERSGLGNTFSHAERMQEPKVQLKVTLSGQLKISGHWRQLAAANCGSAAAASEQQCNIPIVIPQRSPILRPCAPLCIEYRPELHSGVALRGGIVEGCVEFDPRTAAGGACFVASKAQVWISGTARIVVHGRILVPVSLRMVRLAGSGSREKDARKRTDRRLVANVPVAPMLPVQGLACGQAVVSRTMSGCQQQGKEELIAPTSRLSQAFKDIRGPEWKYFNVERRCSKSARNSLQAG
ncbi:hypothetical protein DFH07DRAFT_775285 [Mycena maculata]|uniref:Uncharacterized protein n=1 Tax=Mycena maculata TaxID=230809 RepID=A0AAD7ISX6_9AGAR|nr:hypothetical protein DFH07DRAFT_775285 [Mycena maculata]